MQRVRGQPTTLIISRSTPTAAPQLLNQLRPQLCSAQEMDRFETRGKDSSSGLSQLSYHVWHFCRERRSGCIQILCLSLLLKGA